MSGLYEYCLFGLMCVSILREVFQPASGSTRVGLELVNPLAEHLAWLEHISTSRRQDTLGPLRLETRGGSLCVVGMGRCEPVQSVEHGIAAIQAMKEQIAALF